MSTCSSVLARSPQMCLHFDTEIPPLGICPKKIMTHVHIYIDVCCVVVLWKQKGGMSLNAPTPRMMVTVNTGMLRASQAVTPWDLHRDCRNTQEVDMGGAR